MDDRKRRLINWVIENKKHLGISIVNYSWPKRWLKNVYDFKVSLFFNDELFEGRGTDKNDEVALVKAIMEAFERILIKENGLQNSNGIALHFDLKEASANAYAELLERDSFLCHYLTKTACKKIESEIPLDIQECFNLFSKQDIQTNVFNLKPTNNLYITMTLSTGVDSRRNPFGLCMGLGAGTDNSQAIWKSAIECIRHVTAHLESDPVDHTLFTMDDFIRLHNVDVVDHIKYANNPILGYDIFKQFSNENIDTLKESSVNVFYTELILPPFMKELSLTGIRAHSHSLQNLFFGIPDSTKLNFERLSSFAGYPIDFNGVNKIPHPLG